jgi:alpha-L-fucosidase 2
MDEKIWYGKAASRFEDAMPIGNGRLGAVVFGRPWQREDYFSERILLNEETLWFGGPSTRENPDARKALPEVRRLLMQGKISEAEYLADHSLTAAPRNGRPYQPLGELVFTSKRDHAPARNYRRELELAKGITTVSYEALETLFTSRAFASAEDDVLVFEFKVEGREKLDFHAYLRRRPFDGEIFRSGGSALGIEGQCGPDGVHYSAALAWKTVGGSARMSGQSLVVQGASSVTILVAAATSFKHLEPRKLCLATLRRASKRTSAELEQRHVEDFSELFSRVSISLGKGSRLPTDQRLKRVRAGAKDNSLHALLFQFGRYLMISSSRAGSLPTTLQGIWSDSMVPIWNCNYTLNVNLQMSYWPAETTGLPECHKPLFDFLIRLLKRGKKTAREMYGCRGFVAHHTSDLWADTTPTGGVYASALWPFGGAWLALHAWDHFCFGEDREFLEKTAFPILREAGKFFEDYLVENVKGELVAAPSVSPENWFLMPDGEKGKMCAGASMDSQILRELFNALCKAGEILGSPDSERQKWAEILAKLPPIKTNGSGRIQEWNDSFEEKDPGHRHLSHLFALFPGTAISPLAVEHNIASAASRTLKEKLRHTTDRTGWSQTWIANLYARLLDGEMAMDCLRRVAAEFTHDSLLGLCPPLNLDGNFGYTSAVAEMLLQSHRNELHILPALPREWPSGEVSGLRARGGITVSFKWRNGCLHALNLYSEKSAQILLRTGTELLPQAGVVGLSRAGDLPLYNVQLLPKTVLTIKCKQGLQSRARRPRRRNP